MTIRVTVNSQRITIPGQALGYHRANILYPNECPHQIPPGNILIALSMLAAIKRKRHGALFGSLHVAVLRIS
ncbi:MAG: hypothetical protein M1434_00520 [Chloroflexi bacterium]|nr:hypothetical protein [Chloroflexota bacterium]MCL5273218.1 hypothetical protein [Chloroflexota bacterium]